jgi:hypothetical protein
MDEPERMLNGSHSSLERALLQEGRAYQGPSQLRAHTLAALGLVGGSALAAGGILGWFAAKTMATKVALGAVATALLVGLPASYLLSRDVSHGTAQPQARIVAAAPAIAPAPLPPVDEPAVPTKVAPPVIEAPAAAAPRSPGNTNSSALRAELSALDAVRSTLASGDAQGALVFLDAYARTFPRGHLRLEAEVVRIEALRLAGHGREAEVRAREFLRRHPNSVFATRVRALAGR